MEFRRAIVDECGCIMKWCSDMSEDEISETLDNHPEWSLKCIEVTDE